MQNNDKPSHIQRTFKEKVSRWYSFSKQNIPFYLMIVATILVNGTLDFSIGNFKWEAHIASLYHLTNYMASFYLFAMNLLILILLFFSFSFSKAQSPKNLFMSTAITLIHTIIYILYVVVFITEPGRQAAYSITNTAIISMAILGISLVFVLVSNVLSWIYVDWKYVKVEE